MLAADMGVAAIPENHPDAAGFLRRHLSEDQLFDLLIYDGSVLRTHKTSPYRKPREPARLKFTQLALGLEHLRPGGKMLVLLQKVESWDMMSILKRFGEFSSVRLYKPTAGHKTRSSFYMIADDVQSRHAKAVHATDKRKAVW